MNEASRIIIDDSRVMLQIVTSLTDDYTGVIYDHNKFIVQATGLFLLNVALPKGSKILKGLSTTLAILPPFSPV